MIRPYYRGKWVEIFSPELMISPEMLGFIDIVMSNEGLGGWRVSIWGCRGEGECASDMREIFLGLCATEVKSKGLFLHEVAHALVNEPLGEWHNEKWLAMYKELCGKYLAGVPLEMCQCEKANKRLAILTPEGKPVASGCF